MGTALGASYATATNKVVTAANGVRYAYREVGAGTRPDTTPLVLLQHFRGNLDNWDPALVDALAANRRVVAFDNVGVGDPPGRHRTPWSRWRATPSRSSRPWA